MPNRNRTIYKTCRIAAGLTQEQAIEHLFIGLRALSDYENGHAIPPDEVVSLMSTVYEAPTLAYVHMVTQNPIGAKILPKLQTYNFSTDVIRLQNAIQEVCQCEKDLLKIASDGRVDPEEENQWKQICRILQQCTSATIALSLHDSNLEVEECQALFSTS
jgi:transcriptional regulator with XRE-family HTH domain